MSMEEPMMGESTMMGFCQQTTEYTLLRAHAYLEDPSQPKPHRSDR